ncbi:MAG: isoprenylcysteine carboxylmethyltransferase family protein [Candidatus Hydrothermae bacterium]|nr:isoprenylcysteine carboxylmethyltransferase family protein [Candidatus Hydrothermae bacterium]
MNISMLFWITVGANLLLLAGLWISWVRPSLAIWPPPSGRSWQFAFNWVLFPVVYVGVGLLPFLDTAVARFPIGVRVGLGWPFLVGGLALALWGVAALGWIRSTGIPGTFRVAGPYRWVRNPQYTGIVLALLGWGLVADSWRTLVAGGLHALWYVLAPFLEARTLRERFGKPYLTYVRTVPRFLPRMNRKAYKRAALFLVILGAGSVYPLHAQEVLPRVTIGGRGLFSLNGDMHLPDAGRARTTLMDDLSDTYMLFRFDRKLYLILFFLWPNVKLFCKNYFLYQKTTRMFE